MWTSAAPLLLPLLLLAPTQDPAPPEVAARRGSPLPVGAEDPQLVPVAVEADGELLRVTVDGAPFTTLHLRDVRVPHLHPLLAPGGGRVTRGFPMEPRPGEAHDHPHHQSFWAAHGDVAGVDFWHDPQARIVLRGEPRVRGGARPSVTATLDWTAPDGTVHLVEERTWTFHASATARWVDVHLRLTNPREAAVVLGDTKEGFFALRLAPTLRLEGERAAGSMRNAAGDAGKACWGRRAPWLHVEGAVPLPVATGSPTAEPAGEVPLQPVSVTLFDAPANLRHPTWWHARPYGLVAANPFGQHDFERRPAGTGDHALAPGAVLVQAYRLRVALGPSDDATLEAEHGRFQRDLAPRASAGR